MDEQKSGTVGQALPEKDLSAKAIKTYPTSYVTTKAQLNLPKKMLVELEHWHIEAVHIVIFVLLVVGLYVTVWKKPNLR